MEGQAQQEVFAGFEFICRCEWCKHNDGEGGCWVHITGNPLTIGKDGLCVDLEEKEEK